MDENPNNLHVMPIGDLREHSSEVSCWCNPTQDEGNDLLWVHHALDGRELFETGERKPS